MTTLEILRDGALVHAHPLTLRGVRIGRAPDNDLCIPLPTVSSYHLLLFVRAGEVRVRDLNSTNGTFVDGVQIHQNAVLPAGGELRLGPEVKLSIVVRHEESVEQGPIAYLLDLQTGRLLPLDVGAYEVSELIADRTIGGEAALAVSRQKVSLVVDDVERTLDIGDHFEVSGDRFQLLDVAGAITRTVQTPETRRWHLRVDLSGRAGPVAELTEPDGNTSHTIRAANRVSVLYMLAQQMIDDLNNDVSRSDSGWCPDEELMRGVWGRRWEEKGSASFQVLIHRVRKDLAKHGLDTGVIEKRSGYTRFKTDTFDLAPIE